MATPSESIVTVSGRRCTRSRARTAATSTPISTTEAPSIAPTSTTPQDAQTIQSTSVAEPSLPPPPPPPPPPPVSTGTPEQTTSIEAAPPDSGTSSAVSSAVAQPSEVAPQVPVAAVPAPAPEVVETTSVESVVASPTSTLPATSAPTSSDSIPTAVAPTPSASEESPASTFSAPVPSSPSILPDEPAPSVLPQNPSIYTEPEQSRPTDTSIPSGGSGGVISPDPGTTDGADGLTLPLIGQANVASVVGGVVGGFVGLAIISALLFFCLRRRNTGTFEKWQQRMSEKNQGRGGFLAPLRAAPERLKSIPVRVGVLVAKVRGSKSGPTANPYRRHTRNASSVYAASTNRPGQSVAEPPSKFRQQLRGIGGRMQSLKRPRTLLHQKQDSLVLGPKSPFPGIVDDPVARNSNADENPFMDPLPSRGLQLLNPDPASPRPQNLQNEPVPPKPAATSEKSSNDSLTSVMEQIDAQSGSGTPEWLFENAQQHKRTTSAQTALRSHPTTNYSASIYTNVEENPFFDPSDPPPVPTQPIPPDPPSRPANTYAPFPQFNATSSTVSRMSKDSFFFGEPGPSRPATYMYINGVRQSDPFDLDRPEVLGFGNVGGRMVSGSVTRQASRKRTSTIPNWVNVDDGPYDPGNTPLREPSFKRKP